MSIWSTSSTRWEAASPENDIRLLKHRGRRGTQKRSFAAFLLEAEPARPRKPIARKRGAGAHCVPGGTPAGRMPPQGSGGFAAGTCAPGFRIQVLFGLRRPLPRRYSVTLRHSFQAQTKSAELLLCAAGSFGSLNIHIFFPAAFCRHGPAIALADHLQEVIDHL